MGSEMCIRDRTKDEALTLALEALECASTGNRRPEIIGPSITAIKEALAQPEQEPVAWITEWEGQYSSGKILDYIAHTRGGKVEYTPLYTTPPQRTWVGLTEKDICEAAVKSQDGISPRNDTLRFAIAIEAKLKEKNFD